VSWIIELLLVWLGLMSEVIAESVSSSVQLLADTLLKVFDEDPPDCEANDNLRLRPGLDESSLWVAVRVSTFVSSFFFDDKLAWLQSIEPIRSSLISKVSFPTNFTCRTTQLHYGMPGLPATAPPTFRSNSFRPCSVCPKSNKFELF
jgi:hypothetical protein